MKKTLSLLAFWIITQINAQDQYSIANLPTELLEKSNSVIRKYDTHLTINDYDDVSITEDKVITILNKKGMSDLDAYVYYDRATKIKTLKVTVFNVMGTEINSFKERDFIDKSAVGDVTLYRDDRLKYLEYTPASFPVTIRLEKEIRTNNTAFLKSFRPYSNYYQSIQSSTFKLENNSGVELRSSENEFVKELVSKTRVSNTTTYSVKNLPAVPREVYSPSLETFTPKIMFALSQFELEGEKGEISNWKEFGVWQYENLLKGMDELPKSTISEVKKLTQGLTTKKEKTKAIYKYVQDQMRYISVQIGLGGWKPISAEEVDEKKYGDCKGLTNYTKALLSYAGIESNYCVVHAGSEITDISENFPSMQGNHVILNVPQDGESDIWLECTSQDIPFNFLGTFTDDRNVFAVKPTGGEIIRTPSYSEENNHQRTSATIIFQQKTMKAKVEIVTQGTQYNNRYYLERENAKDIKAHYLSYWDNLKELNLTNYRFENSKEKVAFYEYLELEAENYVKIYGNDLILDVNPFNKFQVNLPKYLERKTPFKVSRGFVDEDEFVFQLDQLVLDTDLQDIEFISEFGTYKLTFEKVNDTLIVKRYFKLKKNDYKKSDYSEFVEFFSKISRFDSTKLSFKLT